MVQQPFCYGCLEAVKRSYNYWFSTVIGGIGHKMLVIVHVAINLGSFNPTIVNYNIMHAVLICPL